MTKRKAGRRGPYRKPVQLKPKQATARTPKPGAADFSAFMNPRPAAREDVTEKELAFIGTVRHFAKLGFDLLAYRGLIFSAEEQSRSPEDRIAGELASEDTATFDRLLKDGVHFAASPRLMSMFMVRFQHQDVTRRRRWKRQFFAGWDPANKKKQRRGLLAGIVLQMYESRRSRGVGSKRAMGEIQRMLDSLVCSEAHLSEEEYPKKYAFPPTIEEEEKRLGKHVISGARVERLLDEARGAIGLRTMPKTPRTLTKKRGQLVKTSQ